MKTTQITVERNFHIMNDDRFIMEKISVTVEADEPDDNTHYMVDHARNIIIQNFKAAYPKVYTHLNFDEVRQFSNGIDAINRLNANPPNFYNPIPTHNDAFATVDNGNFIPPKPTIEEPYDVIKEINSCTSLTVLKIYEKQCKTAEQKDAYKKKAKELQKQSV